MWLLIVVPILASSAFAAANSGIADLHAALQTYGTASRAFMHEKELFKVLLESNILSYSHRLNLLMKLSANDTLRPPLEPEERLELIRNTLIIDLYVYDFVWYLQRNPDLKLIGIQLASEVEMNFPANTYQQLVRNVILMGKMPNNWCMFEYETYKVVYSVYGAETLNLFRNMLPEFRQVFLFDFLAMELKHANFDSELREAYLAVLADHEHYDLLSLCRGENVDVLAEVVAPLVDRLRFGRMSTFLDTRILPRLYKLVDGHTKAKLRSEYSMTALFENDDDREEYLLSLEPKDLSMVLSETDSRQVMLKLLCKPNSNQELLDQMIRVFVPHYVKSNENRRFYFFADLPNELQTVIKIMAVTDIMLDRITFMLVCKDWYQQSSVEMMILSNPYVKSNENRHFYFFADLPNELQTVIKMMAVTDIMLDRITFMLVCKDWYQQSSVEMIILSNPKFLNDAFTDFTSRTTIDPRRSIYTKYGRLGDQSKLLKLICEQPSLQPQHAIPISDLNATLGDEELDSDSFATTCHKLLLEAYKSQGIEDVSLKIAKGLYFLKMPVHFSNQMVAETLYSLHFDHQSLKYFTASPHDIANWIEMLDSVDDFAEKADVIKALIGTALDPDQLLFLALVRVLYDEENCGKSLKKHIICTDRAVEVRQMVASMLKADSKFHLEMPRSVDVLVKLFMDGYLNDHIRFVKPIGPVLVQAVREGCSVELLTETFTRLRCTVENFYAELYASEQAAI